MEDEDVSLSESSHVVIASSYDVTKTLYVWLNFWYNDCSYDFFDDDSLKDL